MAELSNGPTARFLQTLEEQITKNAKEFANRLSAMQMKLFEAGGVSLLLLRSSLPPCITLPCVVLSGLQLR